MNLFLYDEVARSTAHRKCRDDIKNLIFENPTYLQDLVQIALNTKDKIHIKACWILELICEEKMSLFLPYVDDFSENLKNYQSDSAIRSVSKICLFLSKNKTIFLNKKEEEKIIETSLDWLISSNKAANATYAMRTLYQLGKKHTWVNEELKALLSRDLSHQTPGYFSAAKDILKKLTATK
jgi:hypothetical protein